MPDPKALALAAFVAPVLPGDGLSDLLLNRTFWAGFWAWFMAQFLKVGQLQRLQAECPITSRYAVDADIHRVLQERRV
jgi:hypothetical protein